MQRPNLIIMTCHDLGDYLSCYGTPVQTPNLERMAAEGVVLENHFSTGSVCSPSRGSILTGCYPHTHGLMGLVHRGWALSTHVCPPLPELMHNVGYQTHLFGFQHEHWDPFRLGYREVHRPEGGIFCEQVVPIFTDWLRSHRPSEQPFLAAIGYTETHRLGLKPSHFRRDLYEPADPDEVAVPPFLPDVREVRAELAEFYGAVKHVDRMVGEVLDALDELGLSEDTLLIFTSDHGASFMHSKATLYDGGTKVACLFRWRGALPEGHRSAALTSHADIVPTIFDLLDLTVPEHVEGRGFARALRGESQQGRPYVFAEKNYTNYFDPARMVRSHSYKYIRKGLRTCIFDFVIPELELCPSSFRGNQAVFEFYSARRCREELYDLHADPGELHNLARDPRHSEALAELRQALDTHMVETDDPFRRFHNELMMPEADYERVRAATGH